MLQAPGCGPLLKEEWFDSIDVNTGTLSGLAKRVTYTVEKGKTKQFVTETFFKNGTVANSETTKCWTDSDKNYIEERVTT